MKQSRMRIELVNQMPVGVIGIDDENTVVLVNPEAIRLLDADEIPVWGLQAGELLSEKINPFLKNKNKKDIRINIDGTEINIRKSFFYLDNSFAGTILVLWENGQ
jgi:c-di-AMP phosphodiesterase-like protein